MRNLCIQCRKNPKINFEIRYSTGELLTDMKYRIPEKR